MQGPLSEIDTLLGRLNVVDGDEHPADEQLRQGLPFDMSERTGLICGECENFKRRDDRLGRCMSHDLLVEPTAIACESFGVAT